MAVVEKDKQEQNNTVAFNPFDKGIDAGASQDVDTVAAEKAWDVQPPLPDGVWRAKVFCDPDNDGYKIHSGTNRASGAKESWRSANPQLRIQDKTGVWQDTVIFDNLSTRYNAKKRTSTLAAFLCKYGLITANGTHTEQSLLLAFANWVKKEPSVYIQTEWVVRLGEEDNWKVLGRGMKTFAKDEAGNYNPVVSGTRKDKSNYSEMAKPRVIKYLTKAEAQEILDKAVKVEYKDEDDDDVPVVKKAAPAPEPPPPPPAPEPEKKKKTPKPPPPPVEDDEDDDDI